MLKLYNGVRNKHFILLFSLYSSTSSAIWNIWRITVMTHKMKIDCRWYIIILENINVSECQYRDNLSSFRLSHLMKVYVSAGVDEYIKVILLKVNNAETRDIFCFKDYVFIWHRAVYNCLKMMTLNFDFLTIKNTFSFFNPLSNFCQKKNSPQPSLLKFNSKKKMLSYNFSQNFLFNRKKKYIKLKSKRK